jgi:O-antigen/teichoic acid export membrane protein
MIKGTLYRNAIYLISTTIVGGGFGFFFWFIAARFYTPDEVGVASAVISSMLLLAMLGSLGFRMALIRFLPTSSRSKGYDMINSCFTIGILLSVVLGVAFWLLRDVVASSLVYLLDDPVFVVIFIIFTTTTTLISLSDGVFISKRVAKYVLFRDFVYGLLKIPLPVFLIVFGASGIFYSWGISATLLFLFSMVFFMPKAVKGYRPRFMVEWGVIKDMVHFSVGNHLAGIFTSAPGFVLPLMIANMLAPSMAAYFYVSWMMMSLVYVIPIAMSSSFLAEASLDESRVKEQTLKSFKFIFVLLIPAILFVYVLADRLLSLFGAEYSENAVGLLRLLALAGIPLAFNMVYVTIKNIRKEIKAVVIINGVIAVSALVLSYVLMEDMELLGVGVAWITALLIGLVVILLDMLICRKRSKVSAPSTL